MHLQRLCMNLFLLHVASVTVIICFYYYTHSSFQFKKRALIRINQDIDLTITSETEHHVKANTTKEIKTVVNRQEYENYKHVKGTDTPDLTTTPETEHHVKANKTNEIKTVVNRQEYENYKHVKGTDTPDLTTTPETEHHVKANKTNEIKTVVNRQEYENYKHVTDTPDLATTSETEHHVKANTTKEIKTVVNRQEYENYKHVTDTPDLIITSETEHHVKANTTKEIKTVVNRQEYENYKHVKGTDTPDFATTSETEHHVKANKTNEIKTVVNRQEYENYKHVKGTDTLASELHHYFTPRPEKVNPLNYRFLIEGNGVCQKRPNYPLLLIMCLSIAKNVLQRKTIRETWGQVANNKPWPGRKNAHDRVKIMFIFGTTDSKVDAAILEIERIQYGDIVQADFVDSYKNLTRKVMMGIKWATIYCPGLLYLMKVDDDTFVHVENVIRDIRRMQVPPRGIVLGHADKHPRVLREGRWGVSFSDFPFEYYPHYASGQTYVISGNILKKLYNTGEYMPYIFIEDAFVTGILRTVINAQLVRSIGYPSIVMKTAAPCSFHNDIRIAATNLSPNEINSIWKGLSRKMTNCYNCLSENC